MIDVEKLLREGKTEEDILKLLSREVETANLKLEKEREAAKVEALKQEQLKDAKAQAEAALQAVYDLSDGCISVAVKNGKVSVVSRSRLEASRKSKYDKYSDSFWTDLLSILD